MQFGLFGSSRITKMGTFILYLLYWKILFLISPMWMSENGLYTMLGGNHLNACTSIPTFGIGVVPNGKQTSYSSLMVFATR
jgi:hypothetical protein